MLSIRLALVGKKNRPSYRIVVAPKRSSRGGRAVEILGFFDPNIKEKVRYNLERLNYWLKCGAQPTPAVTKILKDNRP